MKNGKIRLFALLMAAMVTASALAVTAQATELSDQETAAETETEERKKPEKAMPEEADASGTAEVAISGRRKTDRGSDKTRKHGDKKDKITSGEGNSGDETEKKENTKKDQPAEPEGAIGREAAKEAALADAGVTAEGRIKVRYAEEDGSGFYKVRFRADGQTFRYRIDAVTGDVLEKTVE